MNVPVMKPEDIFKSDLSVMQTVYGLSLTLGFREVASWVFDAIRSYDQSRDLRLLLFEFLMASVLLLIGIRFFWAAGNIRRFVTLKAPQPHDRKLVTVVHFPILLLHSFLIYFFCRLLSMVHTWKDVTVEGSHLAWSIVGFLILNAVWLFCLVFRRQKWEPELFWIKNNVQTAAVLCAIMVGRRIWAPHNLFLLAMVFLVLNANSLRDLILRADSYLAYTGMASPS
jgi:hypothetical protein